MAEESGFFEAMLDQDGGYDRAYVAKQFADYFALFVGNGVFASPTNQLMVTAGSGMSVIVKAGWAFINGWWYHNKSDKEIQVVSNYGSSNRIDTVKVHYSDSTRNIISDVYTDDSEVVKGEDIYELQLAKITVPPFADRITDAMITDTRPDESVCGWVTGLLKVETTADLFSQLQAQFNAWFDTVKGQLTEDAAGNLQAQVDDLKQVTVPLAASSLTAIQRIVYVRTPLDKSTFMPQTIDCSSKLEPYSYAAEWNVDQDKLTYSYPLAPIYLIVKFCPFGDDGISVWQTGVMISNASPQCTNQYYGPLPRTTAMTTDDVTPDVEPKLYRRSVVFNSSNKTVTIGDNYRAKWRYGNNSPIDVFDWEVFNYANAVETIALGFAYVEVHKNIVFPYARS